MFEQTDRSRMIEDQLQKFMDENVYPNETRLPGAARGSPAIRTTSPPIMKELRAKAKGIGLWNLFLPDPEYGAGLTNLEYTPLCEIMGRSAIAPRVFNCQAPDTGNAEILAEFGTPEQKEQWLAAAPRGRDPLLLLDDRARGLGRGPDRDSRTRAERDGDHYVIDGHKWFTSGADRRALRDRDGRDRTRARRRTSAPSQIIVPTDTPGLQPRRAPSR